MLENKTTTFKAGSILTKEMLDLLYQYPRQFMQLFSDNLADGILCGLTYTGGPSLAELVLTPGVLWWQQSFWISKDPVPLCQVLGNTLNDGQPYRLEMRSAGDEETQGNVKISRLQLCVVPANSKPDGPDFGHFIWNQSLTRLPQNWDELQKSLRNTSFFDVTNVPAAHTGEATFLPLLFDYLRQALQKKDIRNSLEDAMLVQLLEKGTLSLETLRIYSRSKANISRKDLLQNVAARLQETYEAPTFSSNVTPFKAEEDDDDWQPGMI